MSVVLQSIDIETVRVVRGAAGSGARGEVASRAGARPAAPAAATVVTNIARYRTIPSLQALARHYAPPISQPRRSHHWGTDGYRPPLSRP